MRGSCGLELGYDVIPDETTILNIRHLLERHHMTKPCLRPSTSTWKHAAHSCAAVRLLT